MKGVTNFDLNEISLIILIVATYLFVFLTPKKLSRGMTVMSLFWGITIGMTFDFTIGGGLTDFYKLNDKNVYEIFDVVYYFLYGPFGYAFMYLYKVLKINKHSFAFYVIAWTGIGLFAQWLFTILNIVNFQNQYLLAYSFPIFLLTQTVTGIFYHYVSTRD
ncbi:hypothetical protein CJ195_26460 [Bacillus sp. UMB0899]|nr:hypothetical protein CJ195_26460 [Bacillus sp. UMB0899]